MAIEKSRRIVDRNIVEYTHMVSPAELKSEPGMALTEKAQNTVKRGRKEIRDILRGKDNRVILIAGPCSTRDPKEHRDYATRLDSLSKELDDVFVFVQRVYFEKPRTTVGWKGLITDPYLDGKGNINDGLRIARQLLLHNAKLGLPSATEFLESFIPQYIGDLVSWAGIGARTVQSPSHRQMASGLSMPVGFKNSTEGNVQVAIDAVVAAGQPQWFIGIDEEGRASSLPTQGNKYTHIVLRGGASGPNYDSESVKKAQKMLRERGLSDRLVIDCSHGNSNKDYKRQSIVFMDAIRQIADGNTGIVGLMLESNINEGRQDEGNPKRLKYGVSITDACIGWEQTEELIRGAYKELAPLIRNQK